MNKTFFLTLEQILVLHEDQVDRYGGTSGLRDVGLLESAAFRPQTTFGGQELYESLFDKAASLMHSLILNHPFLDGNKRTGTTCALVFLELNSYALSVSQKELVEAALKIAEKEWGLEQIAAWLETNSKKLYF
jgi:death-on-curing protein